MAARKPATISHVVRVVDPTIQFVQSKAVGKQWRVCAKRIDGKNQAKWLVSCGFATKQEAEAYVPAFIEGALTLNLQFLVLNIEGL